MNYENIVLILQTHAGKDNKLVLALQLRCIIKLTVQIVLVLVTLHDH